MSGGVLGQVVDGVSHAVNTALENPLQTAALVTAAIYAPELLASTGGETAGAMDAMTANDLASGQAITAGSSGLSGAGEASAGIAGGTSGASTLANAGLNPSFDTLGNVLQTGDMSSTLAPSITDLSGNAASGVSALGGASTPVASTMEEIMAPTGYTYAGAGMNAAQLASAASALKNATSLLNPTSSGGGGGSSGFAQPAGITGGTSGSGQDTTPTYNENLKMMGNYLNPTQSVNTSGIVPSYRSMSSPMSAKRGGEIHDHVGHPEYPKSPLETVFSTRGGSNYVQGKGTGQSDDIDAKLADGEYVFDADIVSALGDGSNKAGAQALDKMREAIRAHKRSAPDTKIPPKAKSPLSYLEEGNRK
jgi:hypothetical protein